MVGNFSIWEKKTNKENYFGFLKESNLFLIIKVDSCVSEIGEGFLSKILERSQKNIDKLHDFEEIVNQVVRESNLPVNASISTGLTKGNIIYLKTINGGEILLKRNNKLVKIISGDKSASGFIKEKDLFLFTTSDLTNEAGEELKALVAGSVEDIKLNFDGYFRDKKEKDLIILFGEFTNQLVVDQVINQYQPIEISAVKPSIFSTLKNSIKKVKEDFLSFNNLPENYRKKKTTLIFVSIIFLVLVWSVVFGYQRRIESLHNKKITETRKQIEEKLQKAENEAFLDLTKSLELVGQAKTDLGKVDTEVDKKHQKQINEISKLITDTESKLLKKEEKNYAEFYDLAVEEKQAQGEKMSLDEETVAILDKKNGAIYSLSLTKKSLEKNKFSEANKTIALANYDGNVYLFVTGEGIYKGIEEKLKKVVDNDKEWKDIIDLKVYNGNIYLLAKGGDEVYKYLVAEGGYSSKQSYFASGSAVDLTDATSLVIDSAIYLGFSNYIGKYISGVRDEFKTSFPEDNVSLTKVFTNKDLDKVYAWDKGHGVIYVLAKNGAYEKQIRSSIITKASDFVVFENKIYLLSGSKIYTINL